MNNKKPSAAGRIAAGLLSLAALGALAACETVSTTQAGTIGIDRTQRMSSLVSEAQLEQEAVGLYQQTLSQASTKGQLNPNASQTTRVRNIAQRLIGQVGVFRPDATRWNWEINVIGSSEVNAWCMPGGKIAVYTGLLDAVKPTDDELAAVLGHEIAHALREHAREQASQQVATNVGLSVLAAVTGSQAASDLGGTLSNVMFGLPNSRLHETEADRIGVELAARAGYDPRAAVTLWTKMEKLSSGGGTPELLSTHPSAESRIADLQKASQQVLPLYHPR
ncbi:M48 family metallopeptidase [Pigmentiphaga soli]|uniref:M48 family metallopeptidase n=1 Tax=Pigmentiphaga soli TaxID=1007095 RepID=A0ABP8GR21_9BURK